MEVKGDVNSDIGGVIASPSDSSPDGSSKMFTVAICPTTGGQFDIELSKSETIDDLRRKISRHLQTPKERLQLLHKETVLTKGSLDEHKIVDGTKLTLLPAVESGFSSTVQGTQQSIIQAIESLSDPQIDDFLSGRLPLTLALRVGDHMMFVQLQLEQSAHGGVGSDKSNKACTSHKTDQKADPLLSASYRHRGVAPAMGLPSRRSMCHATPINHMERAQSPRIPTGAPALQRSSEPSGSSGPAPKIAKLSPEPRPRSRVANSNELCESATEMGLLYNHQHQAEFFNALNPVICNARTNAYYHHGYPALPTDNFASSPSHLHKLVTAYTSLDADAAAAKTKTNESTSSAASNHKQSPHKEKARKRPALPETSSSKAINYSQAFNSSNSYFPSAALLHDALRRQQAAANSFIPPPESLLPMYAEIQAARQHKQDALKSQHRSSQRSHDPLAPSTSRHSSRHRRSGSKSSKIVSSVGSISSHHASGASGNRVVRQMQRLRRLCGSHQQCVAYSNRELATEISSIVHAAKHSHHQRSSEHRRSHKMCRECYHQNREQRSTQPAPPPAARNSQTKPRTAQVSGACIDSFTTHGPGIFSGTFSGSLHPSIQDSDGKPRRDPQTILQILTDLLTATNLYQGQLGNIGLLPQLFKEQGKNKTTKLPNADAAKPPNNQNQTMTAAASTSKENDPRISGSAMSARNGPYVLPPIASEIKNPAVFKATSSVATVPVNPQKMTEVRKHSSSKYASQHAINRYAMMSQLQQAAHCPYYNHQQAGKCARHSVYTCKHRISTGSRLCCCCASATRKHSKAQIRAKKQVHDNEITRCKVRALKEKMRDRRLRRKQKRADVTLGKKVAPSQDEQFMNESTVTSACMEGDMDTSMTSPMESSKVEVQIEQLSNYKDVNQETAETVIC